MARNSKPTDDEACSRRNGAELIGDVLTELLAEYSARFPQLKIVILGPADQIGPDYIESASLAHPA
jgi:hypothetical protein